MAKAVAESMPYLGRAPRGARGLKLVTLTVSVVATSSRAPRGARGLKLAIPLTAAARPRVVPLAGHVD